jgi:hypothetical protein
MFTRNARRLLGVAILLFGGTLSGCMDRLDPAEYGEIITEVPKDLDKPIRLPELEEPKLDEHHEESEPQGDHEGHEHDQKAPK